eukprot:scaffold19380_cov107-Isochrysis_galbana.AAC.5
MVPTQQPLQQVAVAHNRNCRALPAGHAPPQPLLLPQPAPELRPVGLAPAIGMAAVGGADAPHQVVANPRGTRGAHAHAGCAAGEDSAPAPAGRQVLPLDRGPLLVARGGVENVAPVSVPAAPRDAPVGLRNVRRHLHTGPAARAVGAGPECEQRRLLRPHERRGERGIRLVAQLAQSATGVDRLLHSCFGEKRVVHPIGGQQAGTRNNVVLRLGMPEHNDHDRPGHSVCFRRERWPVQRQFRGRGDGSHLVEQQSKEGQPDKPLAQ